MEVLENLDQAMLRMCDCATKENQVCDICQIIRPGVLAMRSRIHELEEQVADLSYQVSTKESSICKAIVRLDGDHWVIPFGSVKEGKDWLDSAITRDEILSLFK